MAKYDGEIQMFCDTVHEPRRESLRFLRWLVDRSRLEHGAAGPPGGNYAYVLGMDTSENDRRAKLIYTKTASLDTNLLLRSQITEVLQSKELVRVAPNQRPRWMG